MRKLHDPAGAAHRPPPGPQGCLSRLEADDRRHGEGVHQVHRPPGGRDRQELPRAADALCRDIPAGTRQDQATDQRLEHRLRAIEERLHCRLAADGLGQGGTQSGDRHGDARREEEGRRDDHAGIQVQLLLGRGGEREEERCGHERGQDQGQRGPIATGQTGVRQAHEQCPEHGQDEGGDIQLRWPAELTHRPPRCSLPTRPARFLSLG